MRVLWRLLIGMVLLLGLNTPAWAAAPPKSITMEMLVFLPQKGSLAVYQQVALAGSAESAKIGILAGARQIQALGAQIASKSSGAVVVSGSPHSFALKYLVPWNDRSATLNVTQYLGVKALVVLVPPSLVAPTVLNPSLASAGEGKIPGVANSPKFKEFATTQISPGEQFSVVLESKAVAAANAGTGTLPHNGTYPQMGTLFRVLLVLLGLGGCYLAVNWKPLHGRLPNRLRQEQLLGELAGLDAGHRHREVSEDDWLRNRQELLEELGTVWDGRHPVG